MVILLLLFTVTLRIYWRTVEKNFGGVYVGQVLVSLSVITADELIPNFRGFTEVQFRKILWFPYFEEMK